MYPTPATDYLDHVPQSPRRGAVESGPSCCRPRASRQLEEALVAMQAVIEGAERTWRAQDGEKQRP